MSRKSSKTQPKISQSRARRARPLRGKDLERINNGAAIKMRKRLARLPSATYADARQIGSEILRATSRKYQMTAGHDEHDLLSTCLAEIAEEFPRG